MSDSTTSLNSPRPPFPNRWWYTAIVLAISALGLALRWEHAATFDGPRHGHDYAVFMQGVRWVLAFGRPFDVSVPIQVSYYPPLWYAMGAVLLHYGFEARAIAYIAVAGWVVRQWVLAKLLARAAPGAPWSRIIALLLHAVLPLSILMDGLVNMEGLHATLFTVAVYWLWRLERELRNPKGVSIVHGVFFGTAAGLALMTKQTAIAVVIVAVALAGWTAACSTLGRPLITQTRRVVHAGIAAASAWLAIAGWWVGHNLLKFHHPFPHSYQVDPDNIASLFPIIREPVLYRRTLGWFLPFDTRYFSFPIAAAPSTPRPNFWTPIIAGTWGDFFNRGFCRIPGGAGIRDVWDGYISGNCFNMQIALVRLGAPISIAGTVACLAVLVTFVRSRGHRGSFAVPMAAGMGMLFTMLFAAVYPADGYCVVKPNYVLLVCTSMVACCGLALAQIETKRGRATAVHVISLAATSLLAGLVVAERWHYSAGIPLQAQ